MRTRACFLSVCFATALWACSGTPSSVASDDGRGETSDNALVPRMPSAAPSETPAPSPPASGTSSAPPATPSTPAAMPEVPAPPPGMSGGGSESAEPQTNGATGRGQLGGQTGGEAGIRCSTDAEMDPLDFTAKSPLGYSAADILEGLAPSYAASFTYADDSTSALTISLASDGGGAGYAPGCQRNVVDVVVGWSSADGAFAETLHGQLFARSPDSATLSVELPAADFSGSYPRTHRAELMPEPVSFSFEVDLDPSAVHGSVSLLRGPPDAQDSLAIGSF